MSVSRDGGDGAYGAATLVDITAVPGGDAGASHGHLRVRVRCRGHAGAHTIVFSPPRSGINAVMHESCSVGVVFPPGDAHGVVVLNGGAALTDTEVRVDEDHTTVASPLRVAVVDERGDRAPARVEFVTLRVQRVPDSGEVAGPPMLMTVGAPWAEHTFHIGGVVGEDAEVVTVVASLSAALENDAVRGDYIVRVEVRAAVAAIVAYGNMRLNIVGFAFYEVCRALQL